MIARKPPFILSCLCAASLTSASAKAGIYISPEYDALPLRVEQLTLDVDMMRTLSNQLRVIAQRKQDGSAKQWRASAQLLALSIRLDAGNQRAVKLNRRMSRKMHHQASEEHEVQKARRVVWNIVNYLQTEEAGKESNALADRIKDAMVVVDRSHPQVASHLEDPTRWKGVVGALETYRNPAPAVVAEIDPASQGGHELAPDTSFDQRVQWQRRQGVVSLPVHYKWKSSFLDNEGNEKERWNHEDRFSQAIVKVADVSHEGTGNLSFVLVEDENSQPIQHDAHLIKQLLKRKWQAFPNAAIHVQLDKGYAHRNAGFVTAPLGVLLDAFLEGKETKENLFVLAKTSAGGELLRPAKFWETMKRLIHTEDSYRMIVAAACEDDLRQLVAWDQSDFFLRHEVLTADRFEGACELSGEEMKGEIGEASVLFSKLQREFEGKSIGVVTTNRAVRSELIRVLKMNPNHLSTKMLLLRGSGSRPTKLDPKFFAYEAEAIIQHIAWLKEKKVDHLPSKRLRQSAEVMEVELDELRRYVGGDCRKAYDQIAQIVDSLKVLAKNRESDSNFHKRSAKNRYKEVRMLRNQVLGSLDEFKKR